MTILTSGTPWTVSGLTNDHPVIGWNTLYTTGGQIVASFQDADFPASNTANPSTYLRWKSTSEDSQLLHISFGTAQTVDYVAIAGHNLGSALIPIGIGKDAGNTQVFAAATPADDSPLLWRFNPISTTDIWLNIPSNSPVALAPPQISVIYVGRLLYVQRRIYAGHTSIDHGRTWNATDGMSESGQFLGRIITQESRKTKIPLSLLEPAWYRANFDAFLASARDAPFFFSWRPNTYPDEIGYVWLTNQPTPTPTAPSNLISVSLDVTGIN
jgi:hypothetical protein